MQIVRICENITTSLPFYQKLGYTDLSITHSQSQPSHLFSDGRMQLHLQEGDINQTFFLYYHPKLPEVSEYLRTQNIEFKQKDSSEKDPTSILEFQDPNGFLIRIQNVEFDPKHTINPRGDSSIPYGNFGEFAFSVPDYQKMRDFYQLIGFEPLMENQEPYPWGIFTDGAIVLGIHQAPDFDVPSLTYFKVNMKAMILELQAKGLIFTESEMAQIDQGNGITRSPDGLQFFFFEGDIK